MKREKIKDRWEWRQILPLLVEPDGQRVVTREGKRGKLESITNVGTRVAYEILLDNSDRALIFATDLDLETKGA